MTWQQESKGPLTLRWQEAGGPVVTQPSRQGFGSSVIKLMVEQLRADARTEWNADGLIWEITFSV